MRQVGSCYNGTRDTRAPAGGTHPELHSMSQDLNPNVVKKSFCTLIADVAIKNQGTPVSTERLIILSTEEPKYLFNDDILPSYVTNVEDTNQYRAFSQRSVSKGGGGSRAFTTRRLDAELKFIFHFLQEYWSTGDEFTIALKSTLKTCPSCSAQLKYLQEYASVNGKKIIYELIDNPEVETIDDVKNL